MALEHLVENMERVIRGKRMVLEAVVAAVIAGGHVLIEDVPGVGKTVLARSLAQSLDVPFKRIQATPDLLPSDVTGVSVWRPQDQEFEFRPGPVFTSVLLVDEINRATPRTQSALLEAMEERQVTADGVTHPLDEPFIVIATQNPIELAGTFPLPEAQLDRFLVKLTMGYPGDEAEVAVMTAQKERHPLETLKAVANRQDVLAARESARKLFVHASVVRYIQRIAATTRTHPLAAWGASPRGAIALMRASQAAASLRGETFVTPDHVKRLAADVLGHRIVLHPRARAQGATGRDVVEEALRDVAVPVEAAPT